MARFRGTTKSEFEDNRQVLGNAFMLFIEAQRFMRQHLPIAGRIVPGLFERQDDPLYPPAALREALANALCHRDYSVSGAVSIAIYDDRLEITSVGRLPFGLTVADLSTLHPSRPWNPLIAQTFYRRGLVERWGRGTLKMAELNQEAGIAPPEFEEQAGAVTVRFRPTHYVAPRQVMHDLNTLQRDLLQILADLGPSSISTIETRLNQSTPRRTVQKALALLHDLGLARLEGTGRGSRWRLPNKTRR